MCMRVHLESIVIRCSFYLMQLTEEFEGVTGKTGLSDMFGVKWENWVPKIVSYAQLCRKSGTEEYLKLLDESNVSKGLCRSTYKYSRTNSMFIYCGTRHVSCCIIQYVNFLSL